MKTLIRCALLTATTALTSVTAQAQVTATTPPASHLLNVILIVRDQTRYDLPKTATKPARPTRVTRPIPTPLLKASARCGQRARAAQIRATVLPSGEFPQSARHHVCKFQCSGNATRAGGRQSKAHPSAEKHAVWQTLEHALSPTLKESLSAPGMPAALAEYERGWSGALGYIPTNRPDMYPAGVQ